MKYRVHNEQNISSNGWVFHTYFKTKREAVAYAEEIGNAIIERKIGGNWFCC